MKEHLEELKNSVLNIQDNKFNDLALDIFSFQYEFNPIYRAFVSNLSIKPQDITHYSSIPFLPISFFKTHDLLISGLDSTLKFKSSGTTGQERSTKHIVDEVFYKEISQKAFELFHSDLENQIHLALLPSYLENNESSLVYMIQHFIDQSQSEFSKFYNTNYAQLNEDLKALTSSNKELVLWGVSYALLDFVEEYKPDLSRVKIIETGGMKGRKKEMTRAELHKVIIQNTNASKVYSEYGMTELISQAYSLGTDNFYAPTWMKVQISELNDPMGQEAKGKIGLLNIIDLASVETCSFIATEDLARKHQDGSFEVLGRKDNAEIRGCNLLMS
jgi:phenylacetate-coenzyme A ligase PaaK-like adenylate-forming protein